MIRFVVAVALMAIPALAGCQQKDKSVASVPPAGGNEAAIPPEADHAEIKRLDTDHLPNAVQIDTRVISGGSPHGEEGFRELAELGVKTVISVDGAIPDIETAKRHGLRYVHLPHGYDGISDDRARELAKAVLELEGPVYIHCHHGKHRSPAAASVACVTAGLLAPDQAVAVLELAGTSPNYRGLYRSADEAAPLERELLAALEVEFREAAEVPPLAEAMVALELTHDHMKSIAAAGWRSPPEHPDLDPAHEALLLREHFTEILRAEDLRERPADYVRFLRESEEAARQLETALTAARDTGSPDEGALEGHFASVSNRCAECHQAFRDNPQ